MERTPVLLGILFVASFCCVVTLALAQEHKTYKPSEVQQLRLEVKQRDTAIAQRDMQSAQQHFRATLNDYQAEAEKVKKENNWPETLKFDVDTLAFSEAPAKTPPPPQPGAGKKPQE